MLIDCGKATPYRAKNKVRKYSKRGGRGLAVVHEIWATSDDFVPRWKEALKREGRREVGESGVNESRVCSALEGFSFR